MVARVLGAAPILADAIIDQLAAPSDKAVDAGMSPLHFPCAAWLCNLQSVLCLTGRSFCYRSTDVQHADGYLLSEHLLSSMVQMQQEQSFASVQQPLLFSLVTSPRLCEVYMLCCSKRAGPDVAIA